MADEILKPCPFCGVKPRLYWKAWKDVSPDAGVWVLEANHKDSCYITHINGMNTTGRSSARRLSQLVEWWNHREELFGNSEQLVAKDINVPAKDCISRQAAIDAIDGVDWYHQNQHGEMVHGANPDEHQAWYKAEDIYRAVENMPSAQQWIPCSERLPEDYTDVLVWFEYYRYGDYNCLYQMYGIGNYMAEYDSWMINHETGWQKLRVFAWMPLPEPWKGDKE